MPKINDVLLAAIGGVAAAGVLLLFLDKGFHIRLSPSFERFVHVAFAALAAATCFYHGKPNEKAKPELSEEDKAVAKCDYFRLVVSKERQDHVEYAPLFTADFRDLPRARNHAHKLMQENDVLLSAYIVGYQLCDHAGQDFDPPIFCTMTSTGAGEWTLIVY